MARVSADKVLNIARGEIGVPLPSFLVNAVKSLKNKVDSESGKHYLIDKDDKEE